MSRRNLIAIGISLLILLVFFTSLSLSAFKRLSDDTRALPRIEVMPFHSTDILGAKVETADRSQQFFVGIQTGTLPENAVANTFALDNGSPAKEKIPINQHTYRFAFAKFDIVIKMFNYQYQAPVAERIDKSPSETLTQHLNYLVENSTCKKSIRNDIIYLNYDVLSNSSMKKNKKCTPRSNFGLLVQIDRK